MKTRILITLMILALNISLIFGSTNSNITIGRPVDNREVGLLPITPAIADFNDNVPESPVNYGDLAPLTPMEASFDEDIIPETDRNELLMTLSPSTPIEADFEEDALNNGIMISLIPVAPKEADFEDTP